MGTLDGKDILKQSLDCREIVQQDLGPPAKGGHNDWTFPCPFHAETSVGGFRVWADGYRCFSCGAQGDVFSWMTDYHHMSFMDGMKALNGGAMPDFDPVERAKRAEANAKQVAERLEAQISKAQDALKELRSAQKWLEYHNNLDRTRRQLWEYRGIKDDFWVDYWKLGYAPEFKVWEHDGGQWKVKHTSPTLTIPIWNNSWELANLKHRLLSTPAGVPKYMQEKSGINAQPFIAEPDIKSGPAILVEGEIKAMVTFIANDDPDIQVFGIPSKNPSQDILDALKDYEPITMILDPDTYEKDADGKYPIVKVADMLGRSRCRHVRLLEKVDDMINNYALDSAWVRSVVSSAKPFKH
jgi:hypothetical protein